MKKFYQILALVFAVALGYGAGQQGGRLWATDYPTGGAGGGTHPVDLASDVTGELPHGSTSDDAANVHGLPASVNVLGNRSASGEFIQRLNTDDITVDSAFSFFGNGAVITYAVAFSANPIVLPGGTESAVGMHLGSASSIGTTTFILRVGGDVNSTAHNNNGWIALGT